MFDLKVKNMPRGIVSAKTEAETRALINEGFMDCFIYSAKCKLEKDRRLVDYNFSLKYSILSRPLLTITCDEYDNIVSYNCNYCDMFGFCSHLYACIILYETDNEKKLKDNPYDLHKEKQLLVNKFLELEEENKRKIYEIRRQRSLDEINLLLKDIHLTDMLPLSTKVRIDCLLVISEGKNDVELNLKVGIDKMYVVQNISKFLYSITDKQVCTYGKNFSFNHDIENFDDKSKEIIRFLLTFSNMSSLSNNKSLVLSPNQLDVLFLILKEKVINITIRNNKETVESDYVVFLDEEKIRLKIDEKINLYLNTEDVIIFGYKDDYILKENKISKIDYKDASLKVMVHYLYNNHKKRQSYELITDVLKEEIYPRLYQYIDIPESIKNEFKLVEYNIKAYFDMLDDVLVCQTKYYCNDVEVSDNDMSTISYRITKYKNYLENIGFNSTGRLGDMTLIISFLRSDLTELRKIAEVYLSENIKKIEVKSCKNMSTHMAYNTGMLEICFEKSEFSDQELSQIIKSLRKKVKYVKLNKNTIIEIDDATANKILNTVDEFNLNTSNLTTPQVIPLYQSLKLADQELDIVDYKINDNLKSLLKEISGYKKAHYEIPKHLSNVMRPYQKDAFLWMKTLAKYGFCGILADDMGLGKTLEVISVLCTDEVSSPILVVCPKSLCYNWKNEFELWGSDIEVINIIGSGAERKSIINTIDNNKRVVYISSYDSLRIDINYYQDKKFRYLILDEAQSIKNHGTLKAKSVKLIKSELRFVLTGTPIENTIIDLWSIFDFLMPRYLGNYNDFKSKYEKAVVEKNDEKLIDKLVKKITPFVLRRTKDDVLKDLPSKIEFIRMASMETKQKKIYDAQLMKTREILTKDNGKDNKILLLSCLTRLRQICVDPGLFIDDYDGNSCKIDLLEEILDEYIVNNHKIVIFSQFVSEFDKIGKMLDNKKYHYFVLTGKTDAYDRVEMATKFNNVNSDVKVFMVSLKAGGTGLNLIGADVVIHLDPWWNYAVENQATDRTHRIGQTKSVSVVKLIVENSIEQKVIELQRIKKEIADRIISSDSTNIDKLVIDDIKYLLD